MKVLLVTPWLSRAGASGVVTACRTIAEALARQDDVEVVVLGMSEDDASGDVGARVGFGAVRRQRRWALLSEGWPDYLAARGWLRKSGFRPDVVHGQGLAGEGRVAVRLANRLGIPSVVTVHGMPNKEARISADPLRAFLARRVMKQTLTNAAAVVFVSPYGSDDLELPQDAKRRIIPNAIADDAFEAPGRQERSNTILYVGFLGRRKRLRDLLGACTVVRRTVADLRLRVAGPVREPDYADEVRKDVAALGLQDAVDFLGPLSPMELYAEYRSARLLALPSEEENAPQVIAEAMAAGLPVVATGVGGIPWMLAGGGGSIVGVGDLEAMAERMADALRDDARWEEMSRTARAQAERFRADHVAAETLGLYRDLVGREG
ncbi:MAG: glycosyltransferase family 4 protein [Actinomycetota bacterium]|nr:glycosyltransferase family 4 protein [Actinomycetota bacterium]